MAISTHKIPIISGRNDTPTTSEAQANHPNGSFLTSRYNALIDELITELANIDLSTKTTDDLSEGTVNKYYSDSAVNALLTTKSSDDITEGSNNLYYTQARVDANIATKTTDDLTEGTTNLYLTDARVRDAISVTGNGSYDAISGVINISNASIAIDHISLTNTTTNVDTYTIWGDASETITVGTFTVTNGIDGTDGQDGINGADGIDGQGIVSTTVIDNLNGTHTVEFFTDLAKTQKVGEVSLNDGVAGQDGVNGADGVDGQDGVSPTVSVLTQSAYDTLGSYDPNTFYVISG